MKKGGKLQRLQKGASLGRKKRSYRSYYRGKVRDKERHYLRCNTREVRNESIRRNCKVTVVIGGAREIMETLYLPESMKCYRAQDRLHFGSPETSPII